MLIQKLVLYIQKILNHFLWEVRDAAKKVFSVARPLRPYPPPSSLVATIFPEMFLSGPAFPPPLSGRTTKKNNFFAASLTT